LTRSSITDLILRHAKNQRPVAVLPVGTAKADIVFKLNTRDGALCQSLTTWPQRQDRQGYQKYD
jgi:hypothetical protein